MNTVALASNAMATRFEIVLHGADAVALRAAGEEALAEIDRIEGQISLYRPTSQIAHVNGRAGREPVRVTPAVFGLLEAARRLSLETAGTFDITIAPLVRCWGFMGGTGRRPETGEVTAARERIGMDLVELNPEDSTVRFRREGVMLDLGAIGKGYALERASELLREAGVTSALLHGGTSTVYALGHPPDQEHWKVAVEYPRTGDSPIPQPLLAAIPLRDEALSVSAVWGRCFQEHGKLLGHVLDPRTGEPVNSALLSAVALPSATETDALSTGLLVLGEAGHEQLRRGRPGLRTLLLRPADDRAGFKVSARGISFQPEYPIPNIK